MGIESGNDGQWHEGQIAVDGLDIHYVRTGGNNKAPVVLVHGFTDNGRCWTRVAQAIEASADVVMIDARNHGASGAAVGSSVDMGNDVAAVITHLGLGGSAVVGHSLGANAAVELAVRHPELVERLILEDPPWRPARRDRREIDTALRRSGLAAFVESFVELTHDEILARGRRDHPEWHELEREPWATSKRQVRPEAIEAITAHDWADLVPQISCPTLLMHGEEGRGGVVGPEVADAVASLNSLVSVECIEGAGHNVRRENFNGYMQHLQGFLFP